MTGSGTSYIDATGAYGAALYLSIGLLAVATLVTGTGLRVFAAARES